VEGRGERGEGRREKRGEQDALEIPGADSLAEPARVDVRHQFCEPSLRPLHPHRFALDVSDLFHGGFLLAIRERVDMVEDVRPFGDVEGGSGVGLVGWLVVVWFCGKRDAIVRLGEEEAFLVKHGRNKKRDTSEIASMKRRKNGGKETGIPHLRKHVVLGLAFMV